jgi:hypothetical protein
MRHDKAGSTICRDYLVGASSEARDCALWRTGRALPLRWYEENSRAIHRREMQGGRPIPPSCRGAWHAPEPGEHPFSRSQAGAWEREKRVDGLAGRSLLSYYAGKLSKDSSVCCFRQIKRKKVLVVDYLLRDWSEASAPVPA